jgi:hypothetical protein
MVKTWADENERKRYFAKNEVKMWCNGYPGHVQPVMRVIKIPADIVWYKPWTWRNEDNYRYEWITEIEPGYADDLIVFQYEVEFDEV